MALKSDNRVVVFNDTHGWHSEQLVRAFARHGMTVELVNLAECAIDLLAPNGLLIPGFDNELPCATVVRGIALGSLEQITLRMDVLHALAIHNVPVFNSAVAIELTVDKARTSLQLHLGGIATPTTWVCENRSLARRIAHQQFLQGDAVVIKPLFGSQGKGVEKVSSLEQFDALHVTGAVFYMQRYIVPFQQDYWHDWRLMVIDGQVVAAMSRQSQHWVTNFAQGADCLAVTVTDNMAKLAVDATRIAKADYAGVDLIRQQNGDYMVLEVNSVPAWKGLYQATGIAIAEKIANAVVSRING